MDTVTIKVPLSKTGKLKFLIDTGAEISIIKGVSLRPGINHKPTQGINVKGISNSLIRTEGTVMLKLLTPTHETTHSFHIKGDSFDCQYDGILGQDFWIDKEATINYCDRKITMGEVTINFDSETNETVRDTYKLTLKNRTESIVQLPTKSKGHGIISKREIISGVYLAESLTKEINGLCVTSIINTLEEDITIDPPLVDLEEIENDPDDTALILSNSVVEDKARLRKLRDELRTDHLNSEERVSLIKICEEFNDVFHLSGDKLTFTTAAEHNIPTPSIDPTRGINTKPYRIPEVHRDEVQKQTDQMLRDGIIVPSTSPWNSPILVVPKKADASGKKKWRIVVDFRKLNDVTIGDSFPIPVISEILDALGKSRFFLPLTAQVDSFRFL